MSTALIDPPRFADYRWVVVNSSGGKDSQTALRQVVFEADRQGYSRQQIIVSHQDLGWMEWPGVWDLVCRQADAYGLMARRSQYRDKDGRHPNLLEYVRKRRMWPSSRQRFCTSEFKRGPGGRVITELCRLGNGDVLQVFGFRAQESSARARRKVFARNDRASTKTRTVMDWLPIHHWMEDAVWEDIRASGIPWHPAYDMGMPRLSCCFCIFAPRAALLRAAYANPKLLDEYCAVEAEIGHDFKHKQPIREIRDALRAGEVPTVVDGKWSM